MKTERAVKPVVHAYKIHFHRPTGSWSVSTAKGLTQIHRLGTKFYYVDKVPYRYLRDAVMAVILRDDVL